MTSTSLQRFEGRIYAAEGQLHMVVAVDNATATAQVSTRVNGEHVLLTVPLAIVRGHLAEGGDLDLKDMGRSGKSRIQQRSSGWFYATREGLQGPFPTEVAAQQGLDAYILGPMTATG